MEWSTKYLLSKGIKLFWRRGEYYEDDNDGDVREDE